jgi:hypothetical protein
MSATVVSLTAAWEDSQDGAVVDGPMMRGLSPGLRRSGCDVVAGAAGGGWYRQADLYIRCWNS